MARGNDTKVSYTLSAATRSMIDVMADDREQHKVTIVEQAIYEMYKQWIKTVANEITAGVRQPPEGWEDIQEP